MLNEVAGLSLAVGRDKPTDPADPTDGFTVGGCVLSWVDVPARQMGEAPLAGKHARSCAIA